MLSGSARTKHPAEVATFISFMTHDPEVARIMGYDRGVPATTAQFEAYEPSDAPSKAIGAYETAIADAGVLEPITPHPMRRGRHRGGLPAHRRRPVAGQGLAEGLRQAVLLRGEDRPRLELRGPW